MATTSRLLDNVVMSMRRQIGIAHGHGRMIGHPWLQLGIIRLERRTIGHPTLLIILLAGAEAFLVRALAGDYGLSIYHRAAGLRRTTWLYERAVAAVHECAIAGVIVRDGARWLRGIAGLWRHGLA
jgi:hypothetical protein